jgi:EAL domain-containing protein (putative c-di-GMP-specific phosphodiesterase class I)
MGIPAFDTAPSEAIRLDNVIQPSWLHMPVVPNLGAGSGHTLRNDLAGALERGEFELEYQPIVDCNSGRTVAFEALLRWNHPICGRIQPDVFVTIAEETNLMARIGAWVLAEACRECARWADGARVAVNLSATQFARGDIVTVVHDALASSGLAPNRLELELTETCLLVRNGVTLAAMNRLREMGVGLSMDDFGVGYSSLSSLQHFPFDTVKVDRSFVQASEHSDRARRMLEGIVAMCRVLGLRLIVEGVETALQHAHTRSLNVDAVQGYLFGKPKPSAAFAGDRQGRMAPLAA